jgi:hypothetical protein
MSNETKDRIKQLAKAGTPRTHIARELKLPKLVILAVLLNIENNIKDLSRKTITSTDLERMKEHR